MGSFQTPGAYVRTSGAPLRSPAGVIRSDIAAFIGIARRGPLGRPVRIENWGTFESTFGEATAQGYLGDAVRGFFENGGKSCWVVRVADPNSCHAAGINIVNARGDRVAHLSTKTPGTWGSRIRVTLIHRGANRFDLAVLLNDREFETWHDLSLEPHDDKFLPRVLARWSRLLHASVWFSTAQYRAALADMPPQEKGGKDGNGPTFHDPLALRYDQKDTFPAGINASQPRQSGALDNTITDTLRGGTDGLTPVAIVYATLASGIVYGSKESGAVWATYYGELDTEFRKRAKPETETETNGKDDQDDKNAKPGVIPDARAATASDSPALEIRRARLRNAERRALPAVDSVTVETEHDAPGLFRMVLALSDGTFHPLGDTGGASGRARTTVLQDAVAQAPLLSLTETSEDFVCTALARDRFASRLVTIRSLWQWAHRDADIIRGRYHLNGGLKASHFAPTGSGAEESNVSKEISALEALEDIWEISMVAAPDLMPKPAGQPKLPAAHCSDLSPRQHVEDEPDGGSPPAFPVEEVLRAQQALLAHCRRNHFRFAILDCPPPDRAEFLAWNSTATRIASAEQERGSIAGSPTPLADIAHILDWRSRFTGPAAAFGALYYPWIYRTATDTAERAVPPCGHIAGVFARTARTPGVHKAPANEIIEGIRVPTRTVSERLQGILNQQHVNVLTARAGRFTRIMGARTLIDDRNPENSAAAIAEARRWRFISVRRLVSMVEKSILAQTDWTVFEPNSPRLWRDVERSARTVLDGMWRRNMLDGDTANDAYFARCDASTNPPDAVGQGKVVCEIGLQPPWPAEFVTIRLVQSAPDQTIQASGLGDAL